MSLVVGYATYERPRVGRLRLIGAVAGTLGLLAAASVLIGRTLAPAAPPRDPIEDVGGILVGVEHSPAGALAAADNYIVVSYDSVEGHPARDAQLVESVYAPAIRRSAVRGAAIVRAQNSAETSLWARGGQNLSLIGARRLDYYHGDVAQVSAWNCDVFWGPGRPPKQGWVLSQISLRWSGGRWLVAAIRTLPTAGPVPAVTPQATASNDSASAFAADLAGFAAPSYGAPR